MSETSPPRPARGTAGGRSRINEKVNTKKKGGSRNKSGGKAVVLMQKLLNRHKRLPSSTDNHVDRKETASTAKTSSSATASSSSHPNRNLLGAVFHPRKLSGQNPLTNLVTKGLRPRAKQQRQEAQKNRRSTRNSSSKAGSRKESSSSKPVLSRQETPACNNSSTLLLHRSGGSSDRLLLSHRNLMNDSCPSLHDVIQKSLDHGGTVEHPDLLQEEESQQPPTWLLAGASFGIICCILSVVCNPTSILTVISSTISIALLLFIVLKHGDTQPHELLKINRRVARNLEKVKMAHSHLQVRTLASRAALMRTTQLKQELIALINKSSQQQEQQPTPDQVVTMNLQRLHNLNEARNRIQQEVLLVVSKAVLLSNRRRRGGDDVSQQKMVLNAFGMEIMLRRLQTIKGVQYERDDLMDLLESHGPTQDALRTLYRHIMDPNSTLITYEPRLLLD